MSCLLLINERRKGEQSKFHDFLSKVANETMLALELNSAQKELLQGTTVAKGVGEFTGLVDFIQETSSNFSMFNSTGILDARKQDVELRRANQRIILPSTVLDEAPFSLGRGWLYLLVQAFLNVQFLLKGSEQPFEDA